MTIMLPTNAINDAGVLGANGFHFTTFSADSQGRGSGGYNLYLEISRHSTDKT